MNRRSSRLPFVPAIPLLAWLALFIACGDKTVEAPEPASPVEGAWVLESASFSNGTVVLILEPPVLQMEIILRNQIVRQMLVFQGQADTSFGAFTVEEDIITFLSFDGAINIAVFTDTTMTIFTPPDQVKRAFGLENFHETDFLVRRRAGS